MGKILDIPYPVERNVESVITIHKISGIAILRIRPQGPTQQAEVVSARRDAFLSKWRALSGALQAYRERLAAALQLHSFNR